MIALQENCDGAWTRASAVTVRRNKRNRHWGKRGVSILNTVQCSRGGISGNEVMSFVGSGEMAQRKGDLEISAIGIAINWSM